MVEGRYSGVFEASGRRLDAQMCHVWTREAWTPVVDASTMSPFECDVG